MCWAPGRLTTNTANTRCSGGADVCLRPLMLINVPRRGRDLDRYRRLRTDIDALEVQVVALPDLTTARGDCRLCG
jgi:transposase